MTPSPKTVYQRIVEAARKGVGLRLTASEVWELNGDDAITVRAERDSMNAEGSPDAEHY